MKKPITTQRIDRVIWAVLHSPNNSVQRASLWFRLHKLKSEL
jgi:hypothetical protein